MSSPGTGLGISRRTAVLAPLAMPFVARAVEPIRIGLLLAKRGQIAAQTEHLANGTFLALQERDDMIMGRPAELVWLDEPSPQAAAQNMLKLVQEHKVSAVLGGSLSSNALAEEATAAQIRIPFVCDNAAATEITGKNCNIYTFRLNTPIAVQMRILAPYALAYGRKWYHLTTSYKFGQEVLRQSRAVLRAAGGTEAGSDEVPLDTTDFGPFIAKIRQADPEVVIGGLSTTEVPAFLKQWNELGMKGRFPFLQIAIGDTEIWAAGAEAATGTFTKLWEYSDPDNPPEEKAFADAYSRKYRRPAADRAWMGWISARSLFDSIDAAGSLEPMAIVEALEAWKLSAGRSFYGYRKFDHQMLAQNLVVSVKGTITERWNYFDVKATLPENPADLDRVFGTREDVGCRMG